MKFYNQEKLIFGEECDDTKFSSLRYVTKDDNYDHINCSGVSLSSGQIVLDQLHRNECMLQFSDSLRMVVIFILKIFDLLSVNEIVKILSGGIPAGGISKNFCRRMKQCLLQIAQYQIVNGDITSNQFLGLLFNQL